MTRVFLVDDHDIMRASVRSMLEWEDDLAVCGEAATAADALATIPEAAPDLVLIDVSLPDMSGIDLVGALHAAHPTLVLAVLSGHGERSHIREARRAGARGYILKGHAADLADAVRRIRDGEAYLSPGLDAGA